MYELKEDPVAVFAVLALIKLFVIFNWRSDFIPPELDSLEEEGVVDMNLVEVEGVVDHSLVLVARLPLLVTDPPRRLLLLSNSDPLVLCELKADTVRLEKSFMLVYMSLTVVR